MGPLKKLIFAFPFLISFYLFVFLVAPLLLNPNLIFQLGNWQQVLMVTITLIFSLIFFGVFGTLAKDFKIVLPILLVGSLASVIFFKSPLNFYLFGGFVVSFLLSFLLLNNNLKEYLDFKASKLMSSPIRLLGTLIILTLSFGYFLQLNSHLQKEGFKLPDELINTAIKIATPPATSEETSQVTQTLNSLSDEQIQTLRQNPEALKQFGIDPKILDSLSKPQESKTTTTTKQISPSQQIIKAAIQSQFNQAIEPYKDYLPPFMALLFFLSFYSIFALLSLFNSLIIGLIFNFLEKSKYVKFEKEMREVKKLMI